MDRIYHSIIEALIFASDEPIKSSEIVNAVKEIDGEDIDINEEDVLRTVSELNEKYRANENSFSILRIAEGFTFGTNQEYAKYVGYLSSEKSKRRLSQQALETLSIIAYKQPITKPEIESIRGVNSDYILHSLLEKNLITIKGRADGIGRPLLYTTTQEFLKYFGLDKIEDLPKPREIEEIMKDQDFLEQKQRIMMNEIEEFAERESPGDDEDENEDEIE